MLSPWVNLIVYDRQLQNTSENTPGVVLLVRLLRKNHDDNHKNNDNNNKNRKK